MKITISATGGPQSPLFRFQVALCRYLEGDTLTDAQVRIIQKFSGVAPTEHGPWYRFIRSHARPGANSLLKPKALVSVSKNRDAAVYAGSSYNHDHAISRIPANTRYALVEIPHADVLFDHQQLVDHMTVIPGRQPMYALKRLKEEHETIITIKTQLRCKVLQTFGGNWVNERSNWKHLAYNHK